MFRLKDGFRLGVATASAQIEGGDVGSNWNTYSDAGKITDGSNVNRAGDHWNRYQEDIALLNKLKIKDYRMSVEWARIEPKQGQFNKDAIDHYRHEIQLMKDLGIEILLTLHHFSHPQWFEDLGGFEKEKNVDIFIKFVAYVVKNLGDLVSDYCTINEPSVFAVNGYFFGEWLNEEKSLFKTINVMNVLAAAHLKSYLLIHDIFEEKGWGKVNVTFAHHYRWFDPARDNFIDRKGAKLLDWLFQTGIFYAFALGEFRFPFKNLGGFEEGRYIDKIAVNYYSRGLVKNFQDTVKEHAPKNDLGWEIYPNGLIDSIQSAYDIIELPIMITENGTCDNDDSFRPRYIYDHLKLVAESNLPITHYYHWAFTDNFEWKEGEIARFGLVHLDYETQKRTINPSGFMYKEIIENNGVTEEIYNKYIKDSHYHYGERNVLTGLVADEVLKNKR